MKIKAGIVGGAGYTGGEMLRLLLNHPDVEIDFVLSSSNEGNLVSDVHTDLFGDTNLKFSGNEVLSSLSSGESLGDLRTVCGVAP